MVNTTESPSCIFTERQASYSCLIYLQTGSAMIDSMKGVLMKRLARNIVLALLVLSLSSIAEAGTKPKEKGGPPSWAPAHGARAKHRYRYFPVHRIYFDIDRKLYFFLEGSIWKSAPKPPLIPGLPPIPTKPPQVRFPINGPTPASRK